MDLTEFLTQTPAMGALLLIVAWFLKALKNRDCTLKDIGNQCHKVQNDAIEAMRENSRILGENSELVREVTTLLRTLNGKRPG